MESKNQKGIISLTILLVIIVVIAIGGVGYLVYQSKYKKLPLNTTNQNTSASNMVSSVETVQMHDYPAQGILKGHIVCVQKVDEQPCVSTLSASHTRSTNPGESASNAAIPIKTDALGNFSENLYPGNYNINPDPKDGYPIIVPVNNPVTITAGQTTTIKITYMDGTR